MGLHSLHILIYSFCVVVFQEFFKYSYIALSIPIQGNSAIDSYLLSPV